MWPWLFATAVNLANLASSALLGSATVTDDSARLLAAGLGAAGALNLTPIGTFLNIAIAIAASLLFLGLLLLKIAVSVSTLSAVRRHADGDRGLAGGALGHPRRAARVRRVPRRPVWALCFAASAAVSVNALSFNGGGGLMDKLLQPLVAIVLLGVMLKLPISLLASRCWAARRSAAASSRAPPATPPVAA